MRVKVGILINEIVLPLQNEKTSRFDNYFRIHPTTNVYAEIQFMGQCRRTRAYGLISPTSPILPCEQLFFHKEFFGYKTIAELLRALEKEQFSLQLWADYQNVYSSSSLRNEVLAGCEDNALNFLYPYHNLHPSYDHLSRRLHLVSVILGHKPVLVRLTLSVKITGDDESPINRRRQSPASTSRRSSPSRPLPNSALSSVNRPAYMTPTFSWLVSEDLTRRKFYSSAAVNEQRPSSGMKASRRSPYGSSEFLR